MTANKNKIFSTLILSFLIVPVFLTLSPLQTAKADDFGDFLSGIGCDDEDKTGNVTIDECLSGGDNGTVTSFTDFKGDLTAPNAEGYAAGLTQAQDARSFILNVTNFALGFLGLIAVLIVVYGGVITVTSAGNPDGFNKGKKAITFAVIGLLIVMGSFAIVNTVLLAPSGSEKGTGTTNGINTNTIRGVAANARFNYLAQQIDADILKIYNSYQFHLRMKQQLDNAANNIGAFNPDASCSIPYSNCASQLDNLVNTELTAMNNSINDSAANTPFRTGMSALVQDITGQKILAVNAINTTSRDEDCNTLNSGLDVNPCSPSNEALLREKAETAKTKISDLIKADYGFLQKGYEQDLNDVKADIAAIAETVKGISSAELASTYFNAIGGQIDDEIKHTKQYLVPTNDLASIDQGPIKIVIGSLVQIKAILSNLKFVNAVLTTDGTKGNAPYLVNFSTVGSSDPSGLAIDNSKIEWDLDGNGNDNGKIPDVTLDNANLACDATGKTIARCIFKKPGTYRVLVKIKSSSGEDIAPGVSYIDVLVNPPSTKINLTANGQPVIMYDKDGNVTEDHNQIYFTLSEAQKGIEFDASKSEYSAGNIIINDPNAQVRWNFGVPSVNNDTIQLASLTNLKINQAYTANGSYQVNLEVIDKNGVADRKIFTVIVSDLAPRITNPLLNSKIGVPVVFDGSNSTTDGSPLVFNWEITKLNTSTTAYLNKKLFVWTGFVAHAAVPTAFSSTTPVKAPLVKSIAPVTLQKSKPTEDNEFYTCKVPEANDDTVECTFKKAGTYRVTLNLIGSDNKTYSETTQIVISTNPPTAGIKLTNLNKAAPAVYELNGSTLSFDQDDINNSNLEYSWEINPPNCTVVGYADIVSTADLLAAATSNTSAQTPCDTLSNFNADGSTPVVKFNQKGTYSVNLVVRSRDEIDSVSNPAEQSLTVDNVLDVAWGNMKASASLAVAGGSEATADQIPADINTAPVAPITFLFSSSQAVSYELEYGDGESDSGEMNKGELKNVVHNYTKVGKFQVNLSVFDADDIENKISRNVFIGDGNTPVSIVTIKVNDSEVQPGPVELGNQTLQNTVVVNRKDNLVFDAGQSLNTDGTGRRLIYAWNVNNGEKQSTNKTLSHKFNNVSEGGEPYVIKLKTSDERDPTKYGEDSVNVLVVGATPTLRSLTAVPDSGSTTTPVNVRLNAVGAEDEDGQIVQYKWWYYDADTPPTSENRMGLTITTTPTASIVIGTRGLENEKPRYKFGVEITDNDNLSVSTDSQNEDLKLNIKAPEVEVTNGPNKAPVAKFNVDRTSVQIGESVNFTSSSIDPDQGGGIKEYRWDFGDGTKGENVSSVNHTYQKANVDGYKARLTVVDNNSSEATSEAIRIYVDAVAKPPIPAFTSSQSSGSKSVAFTNTSKADIDAGASIKGYIWDFDVTIDSNGDGKKDNDSDSTETNPTRNYADYGIFRAKLTVQDNQGQSQSITNFVNVKPPELPKTTAFTGDSNSGNNTTIGESNSGSNSNPAKSVGADFFSASNKVDPGLLIASIAAYAILLLISKMSKKEN